MTPCDHKPITEEELSAMEAMTWAEGDLGELLDQRDRLIAEVRRLRSTVESYATASNWNGDMQQAETPNVFSPPHPDYRNSPGYKLARESLGWDPPDEPCENPSCDGVKDDPTFPGDGPDELIHRCFKDGRWLDDGSEM